MRFIEKCLKLFPDPQIKCLCGDREFFGQAWLRYLLLEPSISFRLRIRATDKIERNGVLLASKVVFSHLQVGQPQKLSGSCRVWGHHVAVEALRLDDGKLLVVIGPETVEDLLADYALRWGIETLFGIFKTRGFCLESTYFTDPERLRKLFALLTLALRWAMHTGMILNQLQPITLKKHGRRAKSLFRLGFDYIRHLVLNPTPLNDDDFCLPLQFLSCT
jgi:Transposase DDE domain